MQKNINTDNIDTAITEALPERPHHPTSPSKLQMLEWCPSYVNYERDVQHAMTIRGSAQHDVVETGTVPEDMSDEDAVMAMERRQYIKDRIESLLERFDGDVKMITEEYFPIDDKIVHDDKGAAFLGTTAGYLDCALVYDGQKRVELHDWKFGNWSVEPASNNTQGLAYALGLIKKYPKLEEFDIFFHVPRVSKDPDHCRFTRRQLEEQARPRIESVVSRAVAARRDGDFKMARPGYPTCAFCGHIADCPKVLQHVSSVAKKYSDLAVPDDISPLSLLSSEDQNFCMKLTHVVSTWARAFKSRVCDRVLEKKAKCPDEFILVSFTEREVVDPTLLEAVVSKLITKRGWARLKKELVPSLTAIEKVLRSRLARGQKDAGVEQMNKELLKAGAIQKSKPVAYLRARRVTKQEASEKP